MAFATLKLRVSYNYQGIRFVRWKWKRRTIVQEPVTKKKQLRNSCPRARSSNRLSTEFSKRVSAETQWNVCIWRVLWTHKHTPTSDKHWRCATVKLHEDY
ncbi:hypothetical protein Zmor_025268 [Zophobas morio]|uniref:Uncharacterized protein n=1 Tax=Zophobas morio TaxID=2755281 RepID=A0AA38HRU9_9CUCU|nr:hypothetical protein Zmor_025268 [Zophobas morio]